MFEAARVEELWKTFSSKKVEDVLDVGERKMEQVDLERAWRITIKGTVQRKLRGVQNGINRKVLL
jgi:hypothetical protein